MAAAENTLENWGLIAGNGDFPFLVLEGARSRGIEMAVIAIREEAIHRTAMIDRINDFNRDPEKFVPAKAIEAPPGMPIGDDEE